jgi:phage N-6-adenine-methyltransferase
MKAIKSSGNNDYETPSYIFEEWDRLFSFNLDVCASDLNAKCLAYYTIQDNALNKEWIGKCWMNPPYGRGMLLPFVKKAVEEAYKGNLIIGLIPVATSTKWWQRYVTKADHIHYYDHRIHFLLDKVPQKNTAFDSCIAIFGLNPPKYAKEGV